MYRSLFKEMLVTLSSAPFAKNYEKASFFQNQEDFHLNENNIEYFLGKFIKRHFLKSLNLSKVSSKNSWICSLKPDSI